jgi:predicted amidohydrolase YtcJ
LPTKEWIDSGTQDNPVFVMRIDGHMALANSTALNLAGITRDTATPEGGEIVRDADGEPTGVLKDNAMLLFADVIPERSDDELMEAFRLAQEHAFSLGLTEVHSVSASPSETWLLAAMKRARDTGVQKIRMRLYSPIVDWREIANTVEAEGPGDDLLKWDGVKGMIDGALGSTTAWFYDPFTDAPDTSGFPLVAPDQLTDWIVDADNAGLKLAIHAIGDRAIDAALDNFETAADANAPEHRFRIEHFQHPTRDAIDRAARLGVIASMQPYHAIDDGRWAEKRIGAERIKTTYAFRTILDAGMTLTFGSDWPVAPLSPLAGVEAAVARQTIDGENPNGWQPQEKISVEEALVAYTRANAYAAFDETLGGAISVGKRADFVVLTADPREVSPDRIDGITVLKTAISGDIVWSAPE